MSAVQIVILLVCAGLGFGIVNNLIDAAHKPDGIEDDSPQDGDIS